MNDETLRDVTEIIKTDTEGFWLLVDDLTDSRKREAMMALLVAAWGKGYERGLRRGAGLMKDAIIARVNA